MLILVTIYSNYVIYIQVVVEKLGNTMSGTRIHALIEYRFPFSPHNVLNLTTLQTWYDWSLSPIIEIISVW